VIESEFLASARSSFVASTRLAEESCESDIHEGSVQAKTISRAFNAKLIQTEETSIDSVLDFDNNRMKTI
jgi:hypothetical protein